jgi:glutathione S-transferase
MSSKPVLYSFRRCPYAMRARMALSGSGQQVELREVVLRDKPAEMIKASPKATVPVLVLVDNQVLEESLDIMLWALHQNDPHGWLAKNDQVREDMLALATDIDDSFKHHLDQYKYASRMVGDGEDVTHFAHHHRSAAMESLTGLEKRLQNHNFLFGDRLSFADIAIAPFVRQFANTDVQWFALQPCPRLQTWLTKFVESHLFVSVMDKYPKWTPDLSGVTFPLPMVKFH